RCAAGLLPYYNASERQKSPNCLWAVNPVTTTRLVACASLCCRGDTADRIGTELV
ncbi:hypothetical protein AVDCRST_MAG94-1993, partial [uncultured Leptolyngbya sp.]